MSKLIPPFINSVWGDSQQLGSAIQLKAPMSRSFLSERDSCELASIINCSAFNYVNSNSHLWLNFSSSAKDSFIFVAQDKCFRKQHSTCCKCTLFFLPNKNNNLVDFVFVFFPLADGVWTLKTGYLGHGKTSLSSNKVGKHKYIKLPLFRKK